MGWNKGCNPVGLDYKYRMSLVHVSSLTTVFAKKEQKNKEKGLLSLVLILLILPLPGKTTLLLFQSKTGAALFRESDRVSCLLVRSWLKICGRER